MKGITKHMLLTLGLIFLLFRPTTAYAEITEQDNLKVKLQVEKVENTDNEVKAILNITNVGIRPINNINIDDTLPQGMVPKDKSNLTKEIGTINPGDTVTHEFYCESDKTVPSETPANSSVYTSNNTTNNPSTITSNSNGNNAKTGDNNIIVISTIALIASIAFIIFLKKKNKNIKKFMSLFICFCLSASLLRGAAAVQAAEIPQKELSIKESISIDNNLYTIESKINYELSSAKVIPSGSTLTRGEWIAKLVETLDLKNKQEIDWSEADPPFNDITDSQYSQDILYAYINNILSNENASFNPNEPASREFAAVTAVKALGFVGDKDITCEDASDITYLKEADIAVSMGIIPLEENKFFPSRGLTESEAQYIIEGIEGILKTSNIDYNYDNTFEYKDGVIKLPNDVVYEINGSAITFKKNDIISNLKVEDIIVLPDETPYKITNITTSNDDIIIDTSTPALEDTLKYIDVQGHANADMSAFIPAEGVQIIDNNAPNARTSINVGGDIDISKTTKLSIDYEGISGKIEVGIPTVEYKADIDARFSGIDVHNAYIKFLMNAKFTADINLGSLNGETSDLADGTLQLGKVPIAGIPGVTIYAALSVAYEAGGSAKLVYTIDGSIGVQVLDNHLRYMQTLDGKLDIAELKANGKIGPKISGLLEICRSWDLIDFSLWSGAGINATLSAHPSMTCLDCKIFLFAKLTALDDCKIREWLNISNSWDLWDYDNSPLKYNWHFENGTRVPSCTYGDGSIKGTVAEAANRSSFIKDALIQVYKESGSIPIKEITSDNNGKYKVTLAPGTYKLKISKNGYIPFESTEIVKCKEDTNVETYLMVGEGTAGEVGHAGGKITNALNGENISGITINIRPGWNNTSGTPLLTTQTNADGNYEVLLPLGNYTVEMIKNGYISKHYNIYVISGNALNQNNTLAPNSSEMPSGDLRIVLTWGEIPSDLDSHLVGPTADGTNFFHIYYQDKQYLENDNIYADLDLDDITSYGPETTTIYKMNSKGKYSFYVHDYTNGSSPSSVEMSNSGAKVEVYKGDALLQTFNIPANNAGIYWHVFDFDSEKNIIIPVNAFVDGITTNSTNLSLFNRSLPSWEIEKKKQVNN